MTAKRWGWYLIMTGVILLLTACAQVISSEVRAKARKELTFAGVLANPEVYRGETVIWGGRIIETLNEPDKTLLRILQTPLDFMAMPEDEEASQGRFLAEIDRYLDPEVYRKGRPVTVAGKIVGARAEPLGDMEYLYPLVQVEEIHLWKQYPPAYGPPYPYSSWTWFGSPYPWPYYYYWPYYSF